MGRVWSKPSHRNTKTLQVEVCDLCGALVGAADRVLATAEGLAGRYVCSEHEHLALNPSYNDLGGSGTLIGPNEPLLPHSGSDDLISPWDVPVDQVELNNRTALLLNSGEAVELNG